MVSDEDYEKLITDFFSNTLTALKCKKLKNRILQFLFSNIHEENVNENICDYVYYHHFSFFSMKKEAIEKSYNSIISGIDDCLMTFYHENSELVDEKHNLLDRSYKIKKFCKKYIETEDITKSLDISFVLPLSNDNIKTTIEDSSVKDTIDMENKSVEETLVQNDDMNKAIEILNEENEDENVNKITEKIDDDNEIIGKNSIESLYASKKNSIDSKSDSNVSDPINFKTQYNNHITLLNVYQNMGRPRVPNKLELDIISYKNNMSVVSLTNDSIRKRLKIILNYDSDNEKSHGYDIFQRSQDSIMCQEKYKSPISDSSGERFEEKDKSVSSKIKNIFPNVNVDLDYEVPY
uniref:CNDH2_N domain-containing protein n=1 Tax=Strongyloides stercoralis TaxID=6248 RepID=A0A0K0EBX8_STRER